MCLSIGWVWCVPFLCKNRRWCQLWHSGHQLPFLFSLLAQPFPKSVAESCPIRPWKACPLIGSFSSTDNNFYWSGCRIDTGYAQRVNRPRWRRLQQCRHYDWNFISSNKANWDARVFDLFHSQTGQYQPTCCFLQTIQINVWIDYFSDLITFPSEWGMNEQLNILLFPREKNLKLILYRLK